MYILFVADIDECANDANNSCDRANGICNNEPGSYNCECKPGYTGNGTICQGKYNLYYLFAYKGES